MPKKSGRAEGDMALRRRVFTTLIVSVVASVLLLGVEHATGSKTLFDLQLPGFFACVLIWGVHSGPENPAVGYLVFGAANALVYWPLVFVLSFLLRHKRPSRPAP